MSLISLVGLPACGKSTIGRQLASKLEWRFLDADSAVERRAGCSIASVFENFGEGRFRELEEEALSMLTRESDAVIATGGGAILRQSNREMLRARTFVVYLDAPIEVLARRVRASRLRPMFHGLAPEAKLLELLEARDSLYRECAHMVVYTRGLSHAQIIDRIHETSMPYEAGEANIHVSLTPRIEPKA